MMERRHSDARAPRHGVSTGSAPRRRVGHNRARRGADRRPSSLALIDFILRDDFTVALHKRFVALHESITLARNAAETLAGNGGVCAAGVDGSVVGHNPTMKVVSRHEKQPEGQRG